MCFQFSPVGSFMCDSCFVSVRRMNSGERAVVCDGVFLKAFCPSVINFFLLIQLKFTFHLHAVPSYTFNNSWVMGLLVCVASFQFFIKSFWYFGSTLIDVLLNTIAKRCGKWRGGGLRQCDTNLRKWKQDCPYIRIKRGRSGGIKRITVLLLDRIEALPLCVLYISFCCSDS